MQKLANISAFEQIANAKTTVNSFVFNNNSNNDNISDAINLIETCRNRIDEKVTDEVAKVWELECLLGGSSHLFN